MLPHDVPGRSREPVENGVRPRRSACVAGIAARSSDVHRRGPDRWRAPRDRARRLRRNAPVRNTGRPAHRRRAGGAVPRQVRCAAWVQPLRTAPHGRARWQSCSDRPRWHRPNGRHRRGIRARAPATPAPARSDRPPGAATPSPQNPVPTPPAARPPGSIRPGNGRGRPAARHHGLPAFIASPAALVPRTGAGYAASQNHSSSSP